MLKKHRSYYHDLLCNSLDRPVSLIQLVAGPRQVGKTTLVRAVVEDKYQGEYYSTDQTRIIHAGVSPIANDTNSANLGSEPAKLTVQWLEQRWLSARRTAIAKSKAIGQTSSVPTPYVLAIDEIQKIPNWSECVKGLWDEDRANNIPLQVVLLGSSPLQLFKGMSESLAGRYFPIYMPHWSYSEMQAVFDYSLDEYLYFGGYPKAADFKSAESLWRSYLLESLIRSAIDKDILQLTRIDKPALLRSLLETGCLVSGQEFSYRSLQGQLDDAGNTTTLAHYLQLLADAGFLCGLSKYTPSQKQQRASSPKLIALNTALMTAQGGRSFDQAIGDRTFWGHVVETCVGAHLINQSRQYNYKVWYWREGDKEVDFVITQADRLVAIEVKSGHKLRKVDGLKTFQIKYPNAKTLVVGTTSGIALSEFLTRPVSEWF